MDGADVSVFPIRMPMQLEYSLVVRHPDRFADCGVACHSSAQAGKPIRRDSKMTWP
jgi:hypothetical protein